MALRLLSQRTAASSPGLHAFLARWGVVEPGKGKQPVTKDLWPTEIGHEPEVAEMWRVTGAILQALKRSVESRSARLVLFYIPERGELSDREWQLSLEKYQGARRTWRRGRIFDRLRQLSQELQIPLVDPRAAMSKAQAGWRPAYFQEDGHWTEVGHAAAASELARFLVAAGLVRCGPATTP